MMDIQLNGAPHSVAQAQTLAQLIESLALSRQSLAVAVNREIVPRQLWPQHPLQSGDRIDIVRAIGGG